MENRIKAAKDTLRWDNTSCHRFEANQARLKMGALFPQEIASAGRQ